MILKVADLQKEIEAFWKLKQEKASFDKKKMLKVVNKVIKLLDCGMISVVFKKPDNSYGINEWVKKAILLSFSADSKFVNSYGKTAWFDKSDIKFKNWSVKDFKNSGFRAVPGCFVRKGAFIDKNCVIMPSFINLGAHIGEGTMIDSMTTIGSCASIGKNCHISANVCIGGVLEPMQGMPVIIENNCFIGAGSQVTEGTIIREGCILASGTIVSSGVKIINRETGEVLKGEIPPYSVVVPGTYQSSNGLSVNCAIIIKQIDEITRKKVSVNDILR